MQSKRLSRITNTKHCKVCDESITVGNVCSFCKEHPHTHRCELCYVIVHTEGSLCDFCATNPPRILDKCLSCGEAIYNPKHRFKRYGNMCNYCLNKIRRKLDGYDGSYSYKEWLLDKVQS